ncbi:MAG: UDP-N-acetylmuramate dehydrogenase [Oscillospiraceae bacterium]|jgi:UDP-N-acetylmuramate dehydrogenase|nr:UDP-N-acetylmuramate dehydrogenase [Oscillospiraceae bacterium]
MSSGNRRKMPVYAAEIDAICKKYGARFLGGAVIAPYTSFKIGGICDIVKINGVGVLTELLRFCGENGVPRHILGRGSNALISDKGLEGVVLLFGDDFANISVSGRRVECQPGARLSDICKNAAKHSLTGIEFAYGIPGSVGGAVYMNAGAYGGEIKDVFRSCSYLDEGLVPREADASEMGFAYRKSVFSENNRVITGVKLALKRGNKSDITGRMDEVAALRREKQPLEYPSAGSVFKRPNGFFAAKLIDECGLRGVCVGGAQVSDKHCGFIINKNGASFGDVKGLIELIKEKVYAKTGVTLECEIKIFE